MCRFVHAVLSERVSWLRLRCGLPGASLVLELTVGAALEHQVVSSAQEPIEGAFSQHWVREQWVPILGRAIAGDDDRARTSAFADQLIQVIRLLGGVLAHGKVVDDQQRRQQVVAQPSLPGTVGVAAAQVTQQPAGLDELDAVALPSCLVAQTFGKVGLAYSDWATQQNVLLAQQIAAGRQVAQLFLRQLGVERPIEVLEGFVTILEVGLAEPRGQGAIGTSLDLVAEQQFEELGIAKVLLLGLIQPQRQRVLQATQSERLECGNQVWRNRGQHARRVRRGHAGISSGTVVVVKPSRPAGPRR